MENRVDLLVPSRNGTQPKGKAKATKTPRATAPKTRMDVRWPMFGVAFTAVLSAALNGYANAQHAPYPIAGWVMGLAVPVLVLTLSKVAGSTYLSGNRRVGYLAGGSGTALLFLSVWHCASSVSLITGSSLWLAIPMAVSIDCGLVACELALITRKQ